MKRYESFLKGKEIILGITGGIAAYKAAETVRLFKKAQACVTVVMTENAQRFITPLTLEVLSERPVVVSLWKRENATFNTTHVSLSDKADLAVIAPASANMIGKYASGIADDFISTFLLSCRRPVFMAPAMNVKMLENPAVQSNIETLKSRGVRFIEPGEGWLACGYTGKGRMAEPADILKNICAFLERRMDLKGKRILITAGPTREFLDPVRFISNPSSGRMGYALAEKAAQRGADVTLISGPTAVEPPAGINIIPVVSCSDMHIKTKEHFKRSDALIMASAPADFQPVEKYAGKLKKNDTGSLNLELRRTTDILQDLSEEKENKVLIGFAAETDNLKENARLKLKKKNLDMIILNDVAHPDAGFEKTTNIAALMFPDNSSIDLPKMQKTDLADRILDELLKIIKKRKSNA